MNNDNKHGASKLSAIKTAIATLAVMAPLVLTGCELAAVAPDERLNVADIAGLIPAGRVSNAASWAQDIHDIFNTLDIDRNAQNVCTTIAIIDQESNFRADPVVPNLGATSLKALEEKLDEKLGKTLAGYFKTMLATKPSADNNFIKQIKAVKTERELDELYRKMFAYFGETYKVGAINNTAKLLNSGIDEKINPITTLGSMQVHIDYAKRHRRSAMNDDALRDDLYSQYGGLYYGIHRLMRYQADYDAPLYRFADYNSGMYSSRNAALQSQVAALTKAKLTLDGDLLLYDGSGGVKSAQSQTEQAILSLGSVIPALNAKQVRQDLKKEKQQSFESTVTYKAIKDHYGKSTGKYPDYAIMPKVTISGPKLSKDYDTNWFATRVNKRYEACMKLAKKHGHAL